MSKTVAIILAGGSGARFGGQTPKQLMMLAGMPVLEHSVAIFQQAKAIDEIVIVMAAEQILQAEEIAGRYDKVTRVIPGGPKRSDSTKAALVVAKKIAEIDAKVLIHDAARPLLEERIIEDVVRGLDEYQAVTPVIELADTVVEVDQAGEIKTYLSRDDLRRVQTPQGFRFGTICQAYDLAEADPDFEATDDCSIVSRYLPEISVVVVPGSERNIKITEPVDLQLAAQLCQDCLALGSQG